jgi:hypothetical protein
MKSLNFKNPSMHIPDRGAINALVADWTAKNGQIRRFERGFSNDWTFLQNLMEGFGYVLKMEGKRYSLEPKGSRGRPKKVSREIVLARIDEILIANGKEPFQRRAA